MQSDCSHGKRAVQLCLSSIRLEHGPVHAGQESKRHWLAYHDRGGINTRVDDGGFNAVEVVLHDTSLARRRPPLFNDFHGFALAALGDKVQCSTPGLFRE